MSRNRIYVSYNAVIGQFVNLPIVIVIEISFILVECTQTKVVLSKVCSFPKKMVSSMLILFMPEYCFCLQNNVFEG